MERFASAREAVDWINGLRWKGEKKGLENTKALLAALGHPEERMGKILHVAGTNGKGSTCAFLDAALRQCGCRVGLFTSPYLRRFNERIVFDGEAIGDGELVSVASEVKQAAEALSQNGIYCTTFELLTACACLYFAGKGCEYSVMEVGMGGRLDSTNVLPSAVSVIAAIGMDHMQSLGNTLELIASEKAGIMKPGRPAVVMQAEESVMRVFRKSAESAGADLYVADEPALISQSEGGSLFACKLPVLGEIRQKITLAGLHQTKNACLALSALDLLGVDMIRAMRGVENAKWAGRLDLRGNVLVDCAHNPQGAGALKEYVERFFAGRKKVLLTGMMKDKQIEACSRLLGSFADEVVTTQVSWPRAIGAEELKAFYPRGALSCPNVKEALETAKKLAGEDGLVVAAGSVYLAGDVINILEGNGL